MADAAAKLVSSGKKLPWGWILGGVAAVGVTAYAVTAFAGEEKPKPLPPGPEPYKPPQPLPTPQPVYVPPPPVVVNPYIAPQPSRVITPEQTYSQTTTSPSGKTQMTSTYAGPTPDKPIYSYTTMTVTTTSDPLNLRDSPNGKVIGSLPKGSQFNVDKIEGGWAHGQSASTRQIGWASTQYLGGGTTESTSNNPYGIETFSAGSGMGHLVRHGLSELSAGMEPRRHGLSEMSAGATVAEGFKHAWAALHQWPGKALGRLKHSGKKA